MFLEGFGVNAEDDGRQLAMEFTDPLRAYDVLSADGRLVARVWGLVLAGHIGPGLRVEGDTIRLSSGFSGIAEFEERVARGLNGSFVIETLSPLPRRLYLDAGGTIPVVYCARSKRLASSAGLMFDEAEYQARFLTRRHDRLIARDIGGAWIPGFLTAHEGLTRLLPNFYLDLDSWTAHRHWPTPDVIEGWDSLEDGATRAAELMKGYIKALVDEMDSVAVTLTAGYDTRMLLAASHDVAQRVSFVTVGDEAADGIDIHNAKKLARLLKVHHRVVPVRQADPEALNRWDRLVGDATRENTRNTHPSLGQIKADVILTGMYGETGRVRLYERELDKIQGFKPTPKFLSGRLSSSVSDPEVLETMAEWLATVPQMPTSKLLDIAFNEIRFGGWAMAQAPVARATKFAMMPFAQYGVQAAFMNVRPGEQTATAMFDLMIQKLWPEASPSQVAINRYGDLRDVLKKLGKFVNRDHLVRGMRLKLTQRLG